MHTDFKNNLSSSSSSVSIGAPSVAQTLPVPVPRCEVSVRPTTLGDYAFIDRLQQMHSKALGFMPKSQLEGKIALGEIVIAEDEARLPIGYCMFSYRYLKRDELGIVYQMNISPGSQRKLVAASLLKAVFENAPYGCRLFCCWCAQDLNANYFWEALGFIPLAFRAGAKGKRAHIFWQKRIREGDVTTPFWYPCKTDGGHMREGRIVLPIPPGVKWSDEMPMLLPEVARATRPSLPDKTTGGSPVPRRKSKFDPTKGPVKTVQGQFGPPSKRPPVPESLKDKPKPAKKPKAKVDPVHLAKARELRDRYLEQFNSVDHRPECLCHPKYDVSRVIESRPAAKMLAA